VIAFVSTLNYYKYKYHLEENYLLKYDLTEGSRKILFRETVS
jgi:hypothetical protein